ncbi:MAG: hypothetical protein CV087_22235 [Candidatus Brocadia sp. WS118]|nr:MAG: hypothetical protein CV087_22235 [Candidatus Brocadia sp. WS118]
MFCGIFISSVFLKFCSQRVARLNIALGSAKNINNNFVWITVVLRERLTIDHFYTYEVTELLEGGMGYVLLLSLIDSARKPDLMESILQRSSELKVRFRYPYRSLLAAKTVKEQRAMSLFARECNIWLEFEHPGIVPLLKIVDVSGLILALMPQYSGSLRDLLLQPKVSYRNLLKALAEPVAALAEIYKRYKVVHQDIKPENFLYERKDGRLKLLLSDWGIANVQAAQLPNFKSELSQFALNTMGGFGTFPYMAPERFYSYISDIKADIFSLGIMMMEIVTGTQPYYTDQPLEQQIISGSYYEKAESMLLHIPQQLSGLILSMIHPSVRNRPGNYKGILKLLQYF